MYVRGGSVDLFWGGPSLPVTGGFSGLADRRPTAQPGTRNQEEGRGRARASCELRVLTEHRHDECNAELANFRRPASRQSGV
jgi:hypothetical protein